MNLLLAFKINLQPPGELALSEIKQVINDVQFLKHFGNYHDNGWKSIGLITANGDPNEDRDLNAKYYEKTEILKSMPHLNKYLDEIKTEKKRVRIMKLEKRCKIFLHFDRSETYDLGFLRIHIPIITNENVITTILNKKYYWKFNEVWFADFSFPHKVENNSDFDRYHLVIDCHKNNFTDNLISETYKKQNKIRFFLRFIYQNIFRVCRKFKISYPFA